MTRRQRVKIHLTLLPPLLRELREHGVFSVATDLAEEIEREAIVASRADRRQARAILERTRTMQSVYGRAREAHEKVLQKADRAVSMNETEEGRVYEEARDRAVKAAKSYREWLADRFSLMDRWRRRGHDDEAEGH